MIKFFLDCAPLSTKLSLLLSLVDQNPNIMQLQAIRIQPSLLYNFRGILGLFFVFLLTSASALYCVNMRF